MRFTTISLLLASLTLTLAQAPFPIATKSGTSGQLSSVSSMYSAMITSLVAQPAFTNYVAYMEYATGLSEDERSAFLQADDNPVLLAEMFFTASATPAWYTQIPSDLKSYVQSVASAEASIIEKVTGGAGQLGAKVAMTGAVLCAVLVGMAVL